MSTEMKLYEIAPAFAALVEQDDFTEGDLKTLDELNLALKDKAGNIAAITDKYETFITLCETEEKRIKARKKATQNKVRRLNDYLKYGMTATGVKKIEYGTRTISLQNNPPKLVIDNEEEIPPRYYVIVPETTQLDKAMVKWDLKDGEIPGVHLEQGQSIRKR